MYGVKKISEVISMDKSFRGSKNYMRSNIANYKEVKVVYWEMKDYKKVKAVYWKVKNYKKVKHYKEVKEYKEVKDY